jgi:hypothetical protein
LLKEITVLFRLGPAEDFEERLNFKILELDLDFIRNLLPEFVVVN